MTHHREHLHSDLLNAPDPMIAVAAHAEPALIVRRNQADLSSADLDRYKNVFTELIDRGFLNKHLAHHAHMQHRMHGSKAGPMVPDPR